MSLCPCGSGRPLAECCGPRHDGSKPAETPEALMRSRYSAYTLGLGDYLVRTQAKSIQAGAAEELGRWGKSVYWLGLTVQEAPPPSGDEGFVTFEARYLEDDQVVTLFEKSRFTRADGVWTYADGASRHRAEKVGRNAPCPCGSGKKLKQCHGG